jgi:hypothetical protein
MKKLALTTLFTGVIALALAQKVNQSSWQQQVDYSIDVSLNDEMHTLLGEVTLTYHNNSPVDLNEMYIHLWPNAYANNETAFGKQMEENGDLDFYYAKEKDRGGIRNIVFFANGDEIKWEYASIDGKEHMDVAKLTLNTPVKSGEMRIISTPFQVKIPKVFSRLGHENQDYFITQWYPKPAVFDANGWNPMPYLNLGEFYSEFGKFEVNITLPENYTLVATGECSTPSELSDTKRINSDTLLASSKSLKTVSFTASDVHDFAWFASKRWGYETKRVLVGEDEISLRVVGAEPDRKDLDHIQTAIEYYSENVGPYPYSHATVVHGELKAGGGMEYPMITLCDYMSESVIVHEVGHNWFYGILANNERIYPWMDESINSYYEQQALGADSAGKPDFNTGIILALVKDNLLRNKHQAIASSSQELTAGNYGLSVYGIGAKAFGYLKAYLGDARFKKCMTNYYEQWKFKHPLPGDMKRSFELISGEDLSWFFNELLHTDAKMDYSISKRKSDFVIKNKGAVAAPIPVEITRNGMVSKQWVTVPVDEKLLLKGTTDHGSATLDAQGHTLDLHLGNNSTASKIKFNVGMGFDKTIYKEVYIVPTIGWNFYDRMMVGVGVHNYSVSDKALQYHILPMYSFDKKVINGEAAIQYTKPLQGRSEFLELGAAVRKYSFSDRGVVRENDAYVIGNYNYLKVQPQVTYHIQKSTLRSAQSKSICLALDHVFFSPQFDFVSSDTLPGPIFSKPRGNSFVTLTYRARNDRQIEGYSLELNVEYGRLTYDNVVGEKQRVPSGSDSSTIYPLSGTAIGSSDFVKLSGVFVRRLDIGIKNIPLNIRVYGAAMIKPSDVSRYNLALGSSEKAGYYDYKFDDYLMHRNADVGLFQNQINSRTNASKFVGHIGAPDRWLVSAVMTIPLPGKIPLKPYVEFVSYNDIDKEVWNASERKLIFNAGLELEVIKDRFEIFFNLAQTSDITSYQEGATNGLLEKNRITKFSERITFVLDLNGLAPHKLKRSLKLF